MAIETFRPDQVLFESSFRPSIEDDPAEPIEALAQPIVMSRGGIGLDLPLDVRIGHLNPVDIGSERLSPGMIAERLGTNERRVYRLIEEFGIESDTRRIEGVDAATYPAYTLPVLHEEIIWRETYRALPPQLSAMQIAELLGRSKTGTTHRLKALEEADIIKTDTRNEPLRLYPKRALRILKQEDMSIIPAHDWVTMEQLQNLTGTSRKWVVRRLEENGFTSQIRRSALTGSAMKHFPPESLMILLAKHQERPQYGSTWFTERALKRELGRSFDWIDRRLPKYILTTQIRQDDSGAPRVHYPPFVFEELREESEALKAKAARAAELRLARDSLKNVLSTQSAPLEK